MTEAFRAGVATAVVTGSMLATAALAQEQQLSEKAVKTYMDYAWQMMPSKFTRRDNTTIEIDKKQKDKVLVPVDTGREIIMAARLTAYAQSCELAEDQVNNYRSLMLREEAKSKWSPQQMIFINQLHLTTLMLLSGTIKLVEQSDGSKEVYVEDKPPTSRKPSEDQCKKVREQIAAYVKAGPALATSTAAAGAAPATTGATGAPVTKKP